MSKKVNKKSRVSDLKSTNSLLYTILGVLLIILGIIDFNYNFMILGALSFIFSELKCIGSCLFWYMEEKHK